MISIGQQSDGCVYGLDVLSRARLQEIHPGAHRVPVVFVGYAAKSDFTTLHGPMWPQIAQMLTGVTAEQLSALGGVELHARDGQRADQRGSQSAPSWVVRRVSCWPVRSMR